jgi:hypothetical protein
MPYQRIMCVLGMHRSGTSLVTRILNLLGVDLGPEERLLEPGPDNPLGFWEHEEIVELNDEILGLLGGSWHEPPAFEPNWERSPALSGLRGVAVEMIRREFERSELWGWKDPRACLTLPFWQLLIPGMRYVICLRNPVDVARSLARRDGFPVEKSGDLWVDHVEASLRQTAGDDSLILFYEDVMADWPGALGRLGGFIGEADAAVFEHVRTGVWEAVREDLQHHRSSTAEVADHPELPDAAKALYLLLRDFVEGPSEIRAEALAGIETLSRSSRSARRALRSARALPLFVEQGPDGTGQGVPLGEAVDRMAR